jgi:hypothetical protein
MHEYFIFRFLSAGPEKIGTRTIGISVVLKCREAEATTLRREFHVAENGTRRPSPKFFHCLANQGRAATFGQKESALFDNLLYRYIAYDK